MDAYGEKEIAAKNGRSNVKLKEKGKGRLMSAASNNEVFVTDKEDDFVVAEYDVYLSPSNPQTQLYLLSDTDSDKCDNGSSAAANIGKETWSSSRALQPVTTYAVGVLSGKKLFLNSIDTSTNLNDVLVRPSWKKFWKSLNYHNPTTKLSERYLRKMMTQQNDPIQFLMNPSDYSESFVNQSAKRRSQQGNLVEVKETEIAAKNGRNNVGLKENSTEKEDDSVVSEYDVYLPPSIRQTKLYLLIDTNSDKSDHGLSAAAKIDKETRSSSRVLQQVTTYAVGVLSGKKLFLNSIDRITDLNDVLVRPSWKKFWRSLNYHNPTTKLAEQYLRKMMTQRSNPIQFSMNPSDYSKSFVNQSAKRRRQQGNLVG